MEFDKSKILTVVTADQAKVGSMGHFSNYIPTLEGYVTRGCKPDKLMRVSLNTIYPFYDGHNYYSLFYPAPEPTYRPFKNDEEFKPYRDKWLRHGGVIFQHDGYYDCGILIGNERFSWKEMFKSFVFEDGTQFGMKE